MLWIRCSMFLGIKSNRKHVRSSRDVCGVEVDHCYEEHEMSGLVIIHE